MLDAPGVPVLFTDWYDSVRQRALVKRDSGQLAGPGLGHDLRRFALGQLRWDAIRGPRFLLTYAQLLDGALLRRLADSRLIDDVGVPGASGDLVLPFEVGNYGWTVESSLTDIAHRGFLFSSVSGNRFRRIALQRDLAAVRPEEVERRLSRDGVAEGLAGILRDRAGVDPGECARLAAGWQFWIDAERRSVLRTRRAQPLVDDLPSLQAEEFGRLPMESASGRAVRDRIVSDVTRDPETGVRRRSLVYAEIAVLEASTTPAEQRDAGTLKQAFNRCYHRTIARSEGAMLALVDDVGPPRGVRRKAAMKAAMSSQVVVFPAGYQDLLGGMTAGQWQHFLEVVDAELHAWWEEWDLAALQAIGDRLADVKYGPARRSSDRATRKAATAFATVAVGGVGAYADPNLTGVVLGSAVGLIGWVVTEPLAVAVGRRVQRSRERFELVEVWTEATD